MHRHDELTQREHEVMYLIIVGQKNQEIAQELCISVNTVQTHLRNIYRKLGVPNRTAAARAYSQEYARSLHTSKTVTLIEQDQGNIRSKTQVANTLFM